MDFNNVLMRIPAGRSILGSDNVNSSVTLEDDHRESGHAYTGVMSWGAHPSTFPLFTVEHARRPKTGPFILCERRLAQMEI